MEKGALIEILSALPEHLLRPEALGDGAGVRVAVVDSGIDAAHPELRAKVTRSVEVRASAPDKLAMVDAEPADAAGHGTACADIIGRLAPGCELWNVRALGPDCKGSPRALSTALRWAIEQGADVINLSLGTRDPQMAEPLRSLIDAAYRRNLLIVAAANNIPGVHSYPAVFTSLVCVDSDYFEDRETFHFRFGELSELVAPGVYIDAAWPGGGRKLVTG
ncbi:MAG TPA: S8 family serine peptidase, partial [Planctomycetota bacterium]|nr:S8 family serine peptidase [Planctomycetota bacterium]